MKKKVLVFFPHNLQPPHTGADKRCLEMLAGLQEIGCEVTLASSALSSITKWTPSSVRALEEQFVKDVRVYEPTAADNRFLYYLRKYYAADCRATRVLKMLRLQKTVAPINSMLHTPPDMRRWFRKMHDEIAPDIIIMNYAYWDGLLSHRKFNSTLRIIDILDLVSLNAQMHQTLVKYLPNPLKADRADDHVLSEDFFETLNMAPHADEFRIFDKYNYTIAITSKEADLISRHTSKTKISLIPVTLEPCYIPNNYSGYALFTVGPNLFNVQGYLYFAKHVLPQVRRRISSFSLHVTGIFYNHTPPEPEDGIVLRGFVPELKAVYESARFVVCPVFGGTGQQIKIVEAMAHGLPVIALRFAAERSPIEHGINGLVANNAEEFADHVVRLWNDRNLCRRLGDAARETIARDFSRAHLTEQLSRMI
ncbi:MAG: glycosyltransferase family 4 protein [Pyrinomonadaceae bacterium]|nr:glycosyltransferase family 4 protein [Pyrinomonadaceae bacterium]